MRPEKGQVGRPSRKGSRPEWNYCTSPNDPNKDRSINYMGLSLCDSSTRKTVSVGSTTRSWHLGYPLHDWCLKCDCRV